MEKFRLVSMVDFVLEQRLKHAESFKSKVYAYANFLKQPLTLGMFVPCDEYGNVLEEPIDTICGVERYSEKYQQAKERVLFEFFEVIHIDKVRITIQYEFQQLDYNRIRERFEYYNTIEDLTGCHLDLTLTPSALKQIGL